VRPLAAKAAPGKAPRPILSPQAPGRSDESLADDPGLVSSATHGEPSSPSAFRSGGPWARAGAPAAPAAHAAPWEPGAAQRGGAWSSSALELPPPPAAESSWAGSALVGGLGAEPHCQSPTEASLRRAAATALRRERADVDRARRRLHDNGIHGRFRVDSGLRPGASDREAEADRAESPLRPLGTVGRVKAAADTAEAAALLGSSVAFAAEGAAPANSMESEVRSWGLWGLRGGAPTPDALPSSDLHGASGAVRVDPRAARRPASALSRSSRDHHSATADPPALGLRPGRAPARASPVPSPLEQQRAPSPAPARFRDGARAAWSRSRYPEARSVLALSTRRWVDRRVTAGRRERSEAARLQLPHEVAEPGGGTAPAVVAPARSVSARRGSASRDAAAAVPRANEASRGERGGGSSEASRGEPGGGSSEASPGGEDGGPTRQARGPDGSRGSGPARRASGSSPRRPTRSRRQSHGGDRAAGGRAGSAADPAPAPIGPHAVAAGGPAETAPAETAAGRAPPSRAQSAPRRRPRSASDASSRRPAPAASAWRSDDTRSLLRQLPPQYRAAARAEFAAAGVGASLGGDAFASPPVVRGMPLDRETGLPVRDVAAELERSAEQTRHARRAVSARRARSASRGSSGYAARARAPGRPAWLAAPAPSVPAPASQGTTAGAGPAPRPRRPSLGASSRAGELAALEAALSIELRAAGRQGPAAAAGRPATSAAEPGAQDPRAPAAARDGASPQPRRRPAPTDAPSFLDRVAQRQSRDEPRGQSRPAVRPRAAIPVAVRGGRGIGPGRREAALPVREADGAARGSGDDEFHDSSWEEEEEEADDEAGAAGAWERALGGAGTDPVALARVARGMSHRVGASVARA